MIRFNLAILVGLSRCLFSVVQWFSGTGQTCTTCICQCLDFYVIYIIRPGSVNRAEYLNKKSTYFGNVLFVRTITNLEKRVIPPDTQYVSTDIFTCAEEDFNLSKT